MKTNPLIYGVISSVEPGSLAGHAGVKPGDEIININGRPIRDVIDFRFHASDTRLNILLKRGERKFHTKLIKDYDDSLGIDFTEELFDGVRTCRNRCVFCFVDNLPRGMRRSLYIKDDDYRLSFLHGNFVTLSNLSASDIKRILEQRLSPLYVSVHATRPDLRKDLLRSRGCADILPLLRTLAESHIQLHTQIVLCPGINDGEKLDETIEDLAALYPSVQTIGVVPVGLTKYSKAKDFAVFSYSLAQSTLRQIEARQHKFKAENGTRLVFGSDELYLTANRKLPGASAYEGYPQYENGIGITRRFIDQIRYITRKLPASINRKTSIGLITGRLAEPFVRQLAETLNSVGNLRVEVFPIDNDFFGHTVTVAGLITGQDIIAQIKGRSLPQELFVPSVMLRDSAFLDDAIMDDVSTALNRAILAVEPDPKALIDAIIRLSLQP
ncbi:MAG: DUF512 domain-containing protein [Armatimonadota bacterium]|nr:DUF512 domain-containing protein [Armatimonadota bacterium]